MWSKSLNGESEVFPSQSYDVKQPRDPVVCRTPSNGILCAPSASGKTVLLVSMILEQYRGCFERVYIMSPFIDMDPQWEPVKEYIRKELGVNTDREQCWWDEWDEGALRQILAQQKKITQQSKQLGMKKLYQVLVCLDDMADSPQVHKKTGDGILDTLFIRGRHYCINTWVSTQKLRLMPSAVRVNTMWYCVFRLRNQLELDALVEELSAMLPKDRALRNVRGSHPGEVQLLVRQSASPEGRHVLGAIRPQVPRKRAWGRSSARWWGSCWGAARCATVSATTSVLHFHAAGGGPEMAPSRPTPANQRGL